ncbi:glycoprotein integral membrane protein 1 [Chanos chanos]|uniref:Glycoprotein integral membrane protein 1 n=1 Tax=Chanos chanos TaxID=29144 RepID=A0A6J2W1T8_CHACN|nr:glycoprotein integral membrane protein 1 [Chanos chanos]
MASQQTTLLALIFTLTLICTSAAPRQVNTEKIVINTTAVSENSERTYNVQINLNITLLDNQTVVNGFPLKLSEVSRLTLDALLLNDPSINVSAGYGVYVSSTVRVMVEQSELQSDAGEDVLLLALTEEIIELENERVQQPEVCEVKILVNQNLEEHPQITNVYPMSESKLSLIPRDSDIRMTDVSIIEYVEEQDFLDTTSHYPVKHPETTQEEVAAPGKLPETPLRMEPDLLYDSVEDQDGSPDYLLPEVPLRKSESSYNAMCEWMERLRDRMRRFCTESLPLFFLIMWVVVVGVVGSAVIIKILDVLFPSCEHKGFFHLNPATLMPEDEEKLNLVENMETGTQNEKRSLTGD